MCVDIHIHIAVLFYTSNSCTGSVSAVEPYTGLLFCFEVNILLKNYDIIPIEK